MEQWQQLVAFDYWTNKKEDLVNDYFMKLTQSMQSEVEKDGEEHVSLVPKPDSENNNTG